MDNNLRNTNIDKIGYAAISTENKLLRSSFSWMALAMLLTSLTAVLFAFVSQLSGLLFEPTLTGMKPTLFAYAVMFAPLIFVLAIGFGFQRMSYTTLIGLFVAYSILTALASAPFFMCITLVLLPKSF